MWFAWKEFISIQIVEKREETKAIEHCKSLKKKNNFTQKQD